MEPINRTYAPLQAFVDELVRCGLRHAVTCPGSRNAPLALTLAGRPEVEAVSVLDERCAGFFALGMAKATGRPVVVTCTSGTAAANLHPAVIEAWQARVPLIVLTADRPPELREVGAGQSIDQVKLYGSAVNWFVEVGTHEPGRETAVHHRALACRAYWTALGDRPGPVHLNFPLREPLAPQPEQLDAADWAGRADGRPWTELRQHTSAPHADDVQELAARIAAEPRGAIVCGPTGEDVAEPAARLAAACGWPLLAEPTSGVRCGPHDRSHVVAHYDVLLRVEGFAADHPPGLVLRVGDMPTSKPLRTWAAGAAQVVLDPHAAWHEPTRRAELLLRSAAAPTLDALAAAVEVRSTAADSAWLSGGAQRTRSCPKRWPRPPTASSPGCSPRSSPSCPTARSSGSAPRCPCATSRPASPSRPSGCASSPTAARTGSTAWCRPPPAPRWPRGAGLAADRGAGAPARRRRAAGGAARRS